MQAVIVLMVVMLHAAFGCMFVFMNRQHPARFARLLAQSWLLEMVRAVIVLAELDRTGGFSHLHSLSDCLNLLATWWLFAGCADLAGVRLPARLGTWFLGAGVPVVLALRYLAPPAFMHFAGLTQVQAETRSVFIELILIFGAVTAARAAILFWLIGLWRQTRLPGAALAIVFGVPYVVFALAVPLQFHFGYYPEWIYLTWAGRVLGFSLGLVMLLFDKQLAAHRVTEARARRLVDSNIQGVMLCNLQGRITAANDAFLKIVGYTRADLEAGRLDWSQLTPPDWAPRDAEAITELRERGVSQPWEKEYFRKDGTRVPVLLGMALLDEGNATNQAVAFVIDISERKRAEQRALHLANFPELNPNPVLEFNAAGAIAYENPAARLMVRRLGQEQLTQLLPPETPEIVTSCLETGLPRLRLITQHGRSTLSWSFYPIVPQRVVHCYIGDITERTQLEDQLRQAQKMEAVGQLAGGVAHDFNNLLTAIIGHVGLLQSDRRLPTEVSESLGEISRAANRAANLTSQLLAFSRLQVANVQALDLNEVVAQLAKLLERILGEHIAIHLDLRSDRLFFNGDAGMIEQVVINLAVNARDAMPGGGALTIATRSEVRVGRTADNRDEDTRPGPFVCLVITDTGSGIPADVLPKIFEPFFTTKDVGKGTGLGLATAFGIVQQHRGWIEVDSEVDKGTQFRVYLPRLQAAGEMPAPSGPTVVKRGRGEVILLVEDEASVRDVGVRALTTQGYRVLAAADGQSAMELWTRHRNEITLLLTDVIMPGGVTGLQLAQRLQADKAGLRVIYTSGYNREVAGKESLQPRVNYLAKPYKLEELFQIVRGTLDGPGLAGGAPGEDAP